MIYKIFNINDLTKEQFAAYMSYLTDSKKARLVGSNDSTLAAKTVVCEMLARQCLSKLCDAPEFSLQLLLNVDSKSAVTNFDAKISLSSCGDFVACCVSRSNVGISLAEPAGFSFSDAQRLLSDSEIRYLYSDSKHSLAENINKEACTEADVMKKYALLYSLKRAQFFASGRAIMSNMPKINFVISCDSISCSDKAYNVILAQYFQDKNLCCSIVERR